MNYIIIITLILSLSGPITNSYALAPQTDPHIKKKAWALITLIASTPLIQGPLAAYLGQEAEPQLDLTPWSQEPDYQLFNLPVFSINIQQFEEELQKGEHQRATLKLPPSYVIFKDAQGKPISQPLPHKLVKDINKAFGLYAEQFFEQAATILMNSVQAYPEVYPNYANDPFITSVFEKLFAIGFAYDLPQYKTFVRQQKSFGERFGIDSYWSYILERIDQFLKDGQTLIAKQIIIQVEQILETPSSELEQRKEQLSALLNQQDNFLDMFIHGSDQQKILELNILGQPLVVYPNRHTDPQYLIIKTVLENLHKQNIVDYFAESTAHLGWSSRGYGIEDPDIWAYMLINQHLWSIEGLNPTNILMIMNSIKNSALAYKAWQSFSLKDAGSSEQEIYQTLNTVLHSAKDSEQFPKLLNIIKGLLNSKAWLPNYWSQLWLMRLETVSMQRAFSVLKTFFNYDIHLFFEQFSLALLEQIKEAHPELGIENIQTFQQITQENEHRKSATNNASNTVKIDWRNYGFWRVLTRLFEARSKLPMRLQSRPNIFPVGYSHIPGITSIARDAGVEPQTHSDYHLRVPENNEIAHEDELLLMIFNQRYREWRDQPNEEFINFNAPRTKQMLQWSKEGKLQEVIDGTQVWLDLIPTDPNPIYQRMRNIYQGLQKTARSS